MTTPPSLPSAAPAPRLLALFAVALAVRLVSVAIGIGLAALPPNVIRPDDPTTVDARERILTSSAPIVEPWYRWDAVWMVTIAKHGYATAGDRTGRVGVAFMPAMPVTLAAGEALGLNPFLFGLLIANLAGAAGAALFARVAAQVLGDRAAGWRTLALLLAFPTAFFFSAPYNESLGLLFTALALVGWLANRPAVAGVGACVGSLARLTGVALGVAAVADWLVKRKRAELPRVLALVVGSLAGVAIFCGFLWWVLGDPLAGVKTHGAWGRRSFAPWNVYHAVVSAYDPNIPRPDNARHFAWEAIAVVGFTLLGVRAWWKRGAFWGVLTLVPIAQMLGTGTLLSANRVLLASLPAFIELADLLRDRLRLIAVVVLFACAQLVLLNRYVHWQFAG